MKKLTIPTTVRLALDHTALIMTEQPFMKMYSYRNIVIGNIRLEFTIFSTYSTSAGSSTQWRVKDTLLKKYRTIGSICKEFRTSKTFDRNIGKSTKFVTLQLSLYRWQQIYFQLTGHFVLKSLMSSWLKCVKRLALRQLKVHPKLH